jgi:phosphoglycolate phosphatase
MERQARIDGITEPVIFRETARLHGLATDRADFERFGEALTREHVSRLADLRERGRALPGAAATLDALHAAGVRQTVVSGNIRSVAQIKLRAFGLDRHILWELGAYGDDDDSRAALVLLSLRRAGVSTADAVVIGDTPADVAAGHANGVRVIAVASGRSNESALRRAGARDVIADVNDPEGLVRLVQAPGTIGMRGKADPAGPGRPT